MQVRHHLRNFSNYLNDIQGYTDTIHKFTTLFEAESNRLHILEEIQQFFMRHKEEIAKDSADADIALREALRSIKESANSNVNELNAVFVKQAEDFKQILKEEKESFEKTNKDLQIQFESKLKEIPMLEQRLAAVAEIPQKIDAMINRLEEANKQLYSNYLLSTRDTLMSYVKANKQNGIIRPVNSDSEPSKTSPILIICAIIIAIACITNTVHNIWFANDTPQEAVVKQQYEDFFKTDANDSVANDTIVVDSVINTNL